MNFKNSAIEEWEQQRSGKARMGLRARPGWGAGQGQDAAQGKARMGGGQGQDGTQFRVYK